MAFAVVAQAFAFVFSSTSVAATVLRFVGTTLLSAALAGKQDGPRLADLKVQVSTYGVPLPRLYGQSVRVAGNVVDAADILESKHHRGGFGKRLTGNGERFFGLGQQRYWTYSRTVAIALGEGPLPFNALKRIWANGRCIFDASEAAVTSETASGQYWASTSHEAYSHMDSVRFWRGDAIQPVDPLLAIVHAGDVLPAYRHTAYVVIENLQLLDFGNGMPNLEFEVEPTLSLLSDIVEDIGAAADCDILGAALTRTVRGYVVAQEGSCWDFIETLCGVFSFDLISKGALFEAVPRGSRMRTIIDSADLAAVPAGNSPGERKQASVADAISYVDEVTVTYLDVDRDFQTNTQRAFRNEGGFARNKVNVDVPIVLTADEARNIAERTRAESLASVRKTKWQIAQKYRWLESGDIIGLLVGGNIEPVRINVMTLSPNLVIEVESVFEDALAYTQNLDGATGVLPSNPVQPPGDTILQLVDSPIMATADDDTGFYVAVAGDSPGWRGADIERSVDGGATYDFLATTGVASTIGDCATTLPAGAADVWDRVSTLTVNMIGDVAPLTATEADVLVKGYNLAWVGPHSGEGGEFILFSRVTPTGTPGQYTLSNLVRGRLGTDYAIATHGVGERIVIFENDSFGRFDNGPADWNVASYYRAASINGDASAATPVAFTNTGEGKRPLNPVLLNGKRNATNSDILIQWVRRSRFERPQLGGGDTPLGEDVESYEVDVLSGATVVRTLSVAGTPQVNYTAAQQTADGLVAGALKDVVVYQLSGTRGRGHGAVGKV